MQDLWQAHYQILLIIFSEGIHRIKCKFGHDDEKSEACGIKYTQQTFASMKTS